MVKRGKVSSKFEAFKNIVYMFDPRHFSINGLLLAYFDKTLIKLP